MLPRYVKSNLHSPNGETAPGGCLNDDSILLRDDLPCGAGEAQAFDEQHVRAGSSSLYGTSALPTEPKAHQSEA